MLILTAPRFIIQCETQIVLLFYQYAFKLLLIDMYVILEPWLDYLESYTDLGSQMKEIFDKTEIRWVKIPIENTWGCGTC